MTQPTTAWKFSDYYNAIGERIFNDAAPTGTSLVTCKRYVNEGYQEFLQSHTWKFMYPTASLTLSSGDGEETLPDDFGAIDGAVSWSADSCYPDLIEVSPDEIRRRRASNDYEGIPRFYAISPLLFVTATGQQWEIQIYPKTNADMTLAFQYRRCAALLSGATDYPLGGSLHAITILHAAYMVWEYETRGEAGFNTQRFQRSLERSIILDNDLRPRIVGAGQNTSIQLPIPAIDGVE